MYEAKGLFSKEEDLKRDPYVILTLGKAKKKTKVKRSWKEFNPQWNEQVVL